MFLLPGIIIVMFVTKTPIPPEWKIEIARYLANLQRDGGPDDQGWGMWVAVLLSRWNGARGGAVLVLTATANSHFEAKSSVFGTGLNYVVLRLLGVGPDEPMMIRARSCLHKMGEAHIPHRRKTVLSADEQRSLSLSSDCCRRMRANPVVRRPAF